MFSRNLSVNSLLSYVEDETNFNFFKSCYKNRIQINLLNGYCIIDTNINHSQYNLIVIDENNNIIANKYMFYNQIQRLLTVLRIR